MPRILASRPLAPLLLLFVFFTGCIDPYVPNLSDAPRNLLVVDGFINGNGRTRITLSRSQPVNTENAVGLSETRGQLMLQSEDRTFSAPVREVSNGRYQSDSLQLTPGRRYRLFIQTRDGRQYASDYTLLKPAPPIEELRANVEPEGLQIYLSTTDPQAKTRYYRWQYVETWKFTSAWQSNLFFDAATQTVISQRTYPFTCYRSEANTQVTVTSTDKFTEDRLRNYRLRFLPRTSSRLREAYSILVRQYAMEQAEYQYWQALKKNTEDIGTLFDALPTQLSGNVHSLGAGGAEVLGYVAATMAVEKRLIFDSRNVPNDWGRTKEGYEDCIELEYYGNDPLNGDPPLDEYFADPALRVPVTSLGSGKYMAAPQGCVDCSLRGTTVKPDFFQ